MGLIAPRLTHYVWLTHECCSPRYDPILELQFSRSESGGTTPHSVSLNCWLIWFSCSPIHKEHYCCCSIPDLTLLGSSNRCTWANQMLNVPRLNCITHNSFRYRGGSSPHYTEMLILFGGARVYIRNTDLCRKPLSIDMHALSSVWTIVYSFLQGMPNLVSLVFVFGLLSKNFCCELKHMHLAFAYQCENTHEGGGWALVRRVAQGANWHPATDNLKVCNVFFKPVAYWFMYLFGQ